MDIGIIGGSGYTGGGVDEASLSQHPLAKIKAVTSR